ncbi:hypothetical protein DH2020_025101 [Rehmannia glutinosa]|uniref:Glabrous enhancer-binding protein-like DBD domain-containing protein n=1 Tax=Rehmannia glutinosa TaxID=99300 RepID=A0ABR0W3C2_REHGL
MAPKAPSRSRQPPKEKHESSSEEEKNEEEQSQSQSQSHSSEEENKILSDETEGDSSEDEDDEDLQKVKTKNPPNPLPKSDPKSTIQESGSDSDSDLGSPSDYKLQPISKFSKSSAKRAAQQEGTNSKNSLKSSKKSKIEVGKSISSSSTLGGCITRLWSDEDEVTVLKGMIDFRNLKGVDPNADMEAFYNFIKKKLQVDFSKEQLKTKIRGMKKRFLNALKKTENGGDPVFSKPHEDKAFELSKKIWGGNNEGSKNGENAKKDIVVKAEEVVVDNKLEIVKKEEDGEGGDFWSKYPFFSASFANMASNFPSLDMSESMMSFVMKKLSSIGNDKAKELEEKWKQLIKEEAEVNFKMLNLMQEQVKIAFDQ